MSPKYPNPPTLPTFKQKNLWLQALTHRSYANENPGNEHNERLEFLGDAILQFVVGDFLYQRYPHFAEAELTRLRSQLVDEVQLAKFAQILKIGEFIRLGNGAKKSGEQQNPSLLSDTLEAIIGAYFLDAGLEPVRQFIHTLLLGVVEDFQTTNSSSFKNNLIDVKNQLQQWALKEFGPDGLPEYFLIEETGPDHAREFTFGVRIQNKVYGQGKGVRKQEATKAAAIAALEKIYG
ncbi:MAG: ribonuclease III [Snowella sp.]|jgi:ribonuclease-3|nr:MAG: ribonuclease III [Snowella sp.]